MQRSAEVCSAQSSHTPPWVSPPADQRPGIDSEAWVPDSEERLILREEFTSRMHQHFLDGKDGDFDYRCSHALPAPPAPVPQPGTPQDMGSGVTQPKGFRSEISG